jgi:protein-tyrosine phosphatase
MKPRGTNPREEIANLVFSPVLSGAITAHHRPSFQFMKLLKQQASCTTVVTLQSATESPHDIELECRKYSMSWIWVPLQGANKRLLGNNKTHELIRNGLIECRARLERGEVLLIHCAAGIHRTGLFTYALLRISGFSRNAALDVIKEVRLKTFEGCGMNRIDVGEGIAMKILRDENEQVAEQYSYTPAYLCN